MSKRVLFIFLVLFTLTFAAAAQDDMTTVADGLINPRNLSFDTAGNLYVAEAGLSGSQLTPDGDAFGATSQITRISPEGNKSVVVHGLISYRERNPLGATAVQVHGDSIWILLGESFDYTIPFTNALVELDLKTARVKNFIDLHTIEWELDPDGNPNLESNPTDFAVAPDGTILITAAGCNCLLSWTPADGVQVVVAWPFDTDNPVPTSVEVGPDGDVYVGFLTGFPFPEGASRVERWSGGELVQTYSGLTAVTGLLVTAEGTIYASEYGVFEMGVGWAPGRVVMVSEDGLTPVLEGLTSPFGLAQSPDGTIVVAVGADRGPDGAVMVVPTQ